MKNFEEKPANELFKVFHFLYNKKYDINSQEGIKRYGIFKSNIKFIKETNAKNLSYKLGVNKFADMTVKEFEQNYLMDPETKKNQFKQAIRNLREEAGFFDKFADEDYENQQPREDSVSVDPYTPIDWTSSFGEVRSQGGCGSCWTFATAGVVESFRNMKNKKVGGNLSTQHLLDCVTQNKGCKGGTYLKAFTYAMEVGLVDESVYIYKAVQGNCTIPNSAPKTKIKNFKYCSNYYTKFYQCPEDKSHHNYLKSGPMSVGIDGSAIQFFL